MNRVAAALLLCILNVSCQATRQVTQHSDTDRRVQRMDSVHVRVERLQVPVVVPLSVAQLRLHPDSLRLLPDGAGYSKVSGRASVSLVKQDTMYIVTANCDSLTVLVDELTQEVYRLKASDSSAVKSTERVVTVEVNRLTGFQYFQLWSGRIALGVLALGAAFGFIKSKFKR